MTWLAGLTFPGIEGGIVLRPDWSWVPTQEDELLDLLAEQATLLSRPPFYESSTAHGNPGVMLARELADRLGGTVHLPDEDREPFDHSAAFSLVAEVAGRYPPGDERDAALKKVDHWVASPNGRRFLTEVVH